MDADRLALLKARYGNLGDMLDLVETWVLPDHFAAAMPEVVQAIKGTATLFAHIDAQAAEVRALRAERDDCLARYRLLLEDRDRWRDLAVSHAVERDSLRRTLADLIGMTPQPAAAPNERQGDE